MKRRTFCAILPAAKITGAGAVRPERPLRGRIALDQDWKFFLGDPPGAEAVAYDAQHWRTVDLPHDWSIEGSIDRSHPMGGGGGFFPAGVGWYRRTFTAPAAWRGKRVHVEFEGVYMNATVYLNGRELGFHPYGYTSFYYDLTSHLNFGGSNLLAVRVDQSRHPNTRWYSGSGIYRHVWLDVTAPIHIAPWGIFVTSPEVRTDRARLSLQARIANDSADSSVVTLRTIIYNPAGLRVGRARTTAAADAQASVEMSHQIVVNRPELWTPESPSLYRAVTTLAAGGRVVDELTTTFGIRSLEWSAQKGFLLNGKSVKMVGGCVHHDNGPLGAAAFDRAEERKVRILKEAGFHAVRTAHNPPSPAFLDACDRLGILVIDEAFDCWSRGKTRFDYHLAFEGWWQRDLEAMVLRDRNHPSIVMWSIGNEIPDRANPQGAREAKMLGEYVRKLDPTRPVTCAVNQVPVWTDTDPFFAQLDIGGYNYNLENHAEDHRRVPSRVMVCLESYPRAAFEYWELVNDHPYIIGDYVWTAMDYLGEAGIGRWYYRDPNNPGEEARMGSNSVYPWHGSDCGDIDICGFRKAVSHYRNIIWDRGEKLYLGVRQPVPEGKELYVTRWGVYPVRPSWTWPGMEGRPLEVEIYSRCDSVRLYLNNQLIGEKPTTRAERFRAGFSVSYVPGELRAVGIQNGKAVAEAVLRTVGRPVEVRLTADRTMLRADGQDLAFVTVEAVDESRQAHPNADHPVRFTLEGPGTLAAVGNADMTSEERYQGTERRLFQGRALVVVRTSTVPGVLTLTARAPGLKPAMLRLESRLPGKR